MKPKFSIKPEALHDETNLAASPNTSTARPSRTPLKVKQILVPVDFSTCSLKALEYALGLAFALGARLTLLHIVEPAVYPENYLLDPSTLDEANQNLMNSSRERLNELRAAPAIQGMAVETLVRMGRAQSEIPDTAKATAIDLIIMGTHGHSGLKHVFLGGTAERVVRHAPCPVLLVRDF